MKKSVIAMLLMVAVLGLTACGEEDVKVIDKQTESEEAVAETGTETAETETAETTAAVEEAAPAENAGFGFEAESTNGETVIISMDMDMSGVLAVLGEPATYFEAASCAFEGLDKIYTYDHYEVDTYPDGDRDLVSAVLLLDDLVTTTEGAYIGQSQAAIEAIYGTDYEMKGTAMVYTKDGSHLEFVLAGGQVQSVSYQSSVLDE